MKQHVILFATALLFNQSALAGAPGSRELIELTPAQRDTVLVEMNQFISGLQQITAALADDDMETVSKVSRALGSSMSGNIPTELKKALPEDFRLLGGSVHKQFDQIALDAEAIADTPHTLTQLAEVLSSCATCHSRYRLGAR